MGYDFAMTSFKKRAKQRCGETPRQKRHSGKKAITIREMTVRVTVKKANL